MSICSCPTRPDNEGPKARKARINTLRVFLEHLVRRDWKDMPNNGNGLLNWNLNDLIPKGQPKLAPPKEELLTTVPFRNSRERCNVSLRCCGVCTRKCTQRCIQDCLTRMYMWARIPEESQSLAVKMLLRQAEDWAQSLKSTEGCNVDALCGNISWVIGNMLSRKTNTEIENYMNENGLQVYQNPLKMDYSPRVIEEVDEETQRYKRKVDPETGDIMYMNWPESGMCPFCLPAIQKDLRSAKKRGKGN